MTKQPHIVIIGGGFGGVYAAKALRKAAVQITLIDRRNFHLFQPLLYQVATGGLSPANIAAPLRSIFSRQRNLRVLMEEVTRLDPANRRIFLPQGEIVYDYLILATGASHHYFGKEEWEHQAPGLKTIEDATNIRRRVLSAFEEAERRLIHGGTIEDVRALLTFLVVGAGATGVELAGAIAELSRHTLRRDFRAIDPSTARVLLIEGSDRVLPGYHPTLSVKAARSLGKMGVVVRTQTLVTELQPGAVTLAWGPAEQRTTEVIAARTVLWAAGVQGSGLGARLAETTGVQLDRVGRVIVEPDLTIKGHPEIFVIGDLAHYAHQNNQPLPGVAQVAMQQGSHVAGHIKARLNGTSVKPFYYRDHGSMATIGRARAVADLGWIRLSGYPAWLAWLFIHLIYLVEFQNRLLVLMQWGWNYATRGRSARLITDTPERH